MLWLVIRQVTSVVLECLDDARGGVAVVVVEEISQDLGEICPPACKEDAEPAIKLSRSRDTCT